jgi:hypothetical protein
MRDDRAETKCLLIVSIVDPVVLLYVGEAHGERFPTKRIRAEGSEGFDGEK